jgi:hypothetical protein
VLPIRDSVSAATDGGAMCMRGANSVFSPVSARKG